MTFNVFILGIGFEIAKKIAAAELKCIITARNHEQGRAAKEALSSFGDVEFRVLDISDRSSIAQFVDEFSRDFGKCDILVNNAGFAFKSADPTPFDRQAGPTFATNLFGTINFTEAMLPLLRRGESPRIVNVSSRAGLLRILKSNEELKSRVTASDLTLSEIIDLATSFVRDVEAGVHAEKGWPNSNYGMSKLLLTAYSHVLARQEGAGMQVNACCPGAVQKHILFSLVLAATRFH